MIIVSQDKVANINYNNIEATYLLKKDDKIEINMRGNYNYTIGKYKTEERAKEVFQEIIEKYESCNSSMGSQGYVKNKTFYMPEE